MNQIQRGNLLQKKHDLGVYHAPQPKDRGTSVSFCDPPSTPTHMTKGNQILHCRQTRWKFYRVYQRGDVLGERQELVTRLLTRDLMRQLTLFVEIFPCFDHIVQRGARWSRGWDIFMSVQRVCLRHFALYSHTTYTNWKHTVRRHHNYVYTQIHLLVNMTAYKNTKQEAQLMLTSPRDAIRGQSRSPNMVPFHSTC